MTLCNVCHFVRVGIEGAICATCSKNERKNTFLENTVKEYLSKHPDLALYTFADKSIPCATTKRRPDFCYVLPDRVVILEVDENEHRYNTLECETRREHELLDAIPSEKHLVIVRFNPNPSRGDMWAAFERLGEKLRHAFITDDVKYTDDGIHRIYLNYSSGRKRKLTRAMHEDQQKALKEGGNASPTTKEQAHADVENQDSDGAEALAHITTMYNYHETQFRKYRRLLKSKMKRTNKMLLEPSKKIEPKESNTGLSDKDAMTLLLEQWWSWMKEEQYKEFENVWATKYPVSTHTFFAFWRYWSEWNEECKECRLVTKNHLSIFLSKKLNEKTKQYKKCSAIHHIDSVNGKLSYTFTEEDEHLRHRRGFSSLAVRKMLLPNTRSAASST